MKKVTIYSTPTCTYCLMAKDFLTENNIAFEEYDVSVELEKREEMLALTDGQMGVPVIVIDGEVIFGFNRDKVAELLGL